MFGAAAHPSPASPPPTPLLHIPSIRSGPATSRTAGIYSNTTLRATFLFTTFLSVVSCHFFSFGRKWARPIMKLARAAVKLWFRFDAELFFPHTSMWKQKKASEFGVKVHPAASSSVFEGLQSRLNRRIYIEIHSKSGFCHANVNGPPPPDPNQFCSDKGRLWWSFYVGPARMDVVDETEALQRFFEGKNIWRSYLRVKLIVNIFYY